jgi:hypothetical protein
MTLILSFLAAHMSAVIPSLIALATAAWAVISHVGAKATAADAQAKVANMQAQVAVGNAAAAQAGADAAVKAAQVDVDVAKIPDASLVQAAADAGILRSDK